MTRQRRRHGEGSITLERGKYRVRIPDGSGGAISLGTYPTPERAEQVKAAGLLQRARYVRSAELYEYGERVIERWAKAGMRDARATRSRWSAIVARAAFARLPLEAITRSDVRDWARALQADPVLGPGGVPIAGRTLSWQSAKHALGLVSRVLAEAVDDGLLDVNPAAGVRLPRRQATAEGWSWLAVAELAAVFDLPLTLEQRTAFTLAVYQGLRQGELAALTWERIDFEAGWMLVAASWGTATKAGRARRIPLLAPARAALERWGPDQAKRVGFVLPAPAGAMRARGHDWGWGDRRSGKDVPTRAHIARRVRFHDLRHTCAAHLVSGTWGRAWRLDEVRDYLGHTAVAVTQRYAHLSPESLHATARATAAEPAANLPRDASRVASQLLEIIERAMRDSNPRPSAPEAEGSAAIPHAEDRARQLCGRSAEVGAAILERAAVELAIAIDCSAQASKGARRS